MREVVRAAREYGLPALTLYAFSAQNWDRPLEEVQGLMQLLHDYLIEERAEIMDNGIRLIAIGNVKRLPDFVKAPLQALMADSAHHRAMTLCLALSYGGREAIIEAIRTAAKEVQAGTLRPDELDEAALGLSVVVGRRGEPGLEPVVVFAQERIADHGPSNSRSCWSWAITGGLSSSSHG